MNLTLDAINTIKNGAAAMSREEFVAKHTDMLDQLHAIESLADGAMSMLHDLNMAKEACERCGVTKEWLDEFNADNRLFTLCNIEMPKFFGGDVEKKSAAMEGIGATIWDWVKRAWEILRKIFAWIYNAIKMVITFLTDSRRPQLTAQVEDIKKFVDYLIQLKLESKYNFRKETYDVVTCDPSQLVRFFGKLRVLFTVLEDQSGNLNFDFIKSFAINGKSQFETNTDDPQTDVYTRIVELVYGEPYVKDDINENGFAITEKGFQFFNAEKIASVTSFKTNPLDRDFNKVLEAVSTAEASMMNLKPILNKHYDAVAAFEKLVRNTLEATRVAQQNLGENTPNADIQRLNVAVIKTRTLLGFITGAMSYLAVLISAATKSRSAILNSLIRMKRDLPDLIKDPSPVK